MKNNKFLGQHWLKDRLILDDIADLAAGLGIGEDSGIVSSDLVLEIGPGLGTLTSSLLKRFDKVVAVEYDARLAENLPKSFPGKNLEVINADFLDFDLETVPASYVVAGNIPYYITSPIIMKLVEAKNCPERIVLLIQKEVAERIVALDKRESVLSLSVKNYANVALGPVVPREYFTPVPKVDSQIIILEPHAPLVSEDVMTLIKRGFVAPRKKLVSNLGGGKKHLLEIFAKLRISPNARPSDLSLETWQLLADKLSEL